MSRTMTALVASGLVASSLIAFAGSASAAPVVSPQALKSAVQVDTSSNVETVRWYGRGGWGRGGWGYGGFAAGAIVGGALASRYYYPPGYYYDPYYAPPPPPPAYYGGSDDVGYCMSRFRSYDPRSGTYMGNDGRRHPCP